MTKSQDRLEARRAIQERAIARRHGASRKEERIAKLGTTLNDPLCQHYGGVGEPHPQRCRSQPAGPTDRTARPRPETTNTPRPEPGRSPTV
jgi:hypothetical protein